MRRILRSLNPFKRRSTRLDVIQPPSATAFRHSILQAIIAVRLKHQEISNCCVEVRCDILGCLVQGGNYRGSCGLSGNEQDTLDDQARLYAASYLRDMYAVGGLLLLLTFLQLLSQRADLRNMKTVKTMLHRGETIPQRFECPPTLSVAVASVLWASSIIPSELLEIKKSLWQLFGDDWCRRAAENQLPNAPVHARIYHLLYTKQVREPSEKDCLMLIEEMFRELEVLPSHTAPSGPALAMIEGPPHSSGFGGALGLPSFKGSASTVRFDPRLSAIGGGSLCEPRARLEAIKLATTTGASLGPPATTTATTTTTTATTTLTSHLPVQSKPRPYRLSGHMTPTGPNTNQKYLEAVGLDFTTPVTHEPYAGRTNETSKVSCEQGTTSGTEGSSSALMQTGAFVPAPIPHLD